MNKCKRHKNIIRKVAKHTEFRETDVSFIIDEYIDVIKDELLNNNCVRIKGIGKIYIVDHKKYGKVIKFKVSTNLRKNIKQEVLL